MVTRTSIVMSVVMAEPDVRVLGLGMSSRALFFWSNASRHWRGMLNSILYGSLFPGFSGKGLPSEEKGIWMA